jgi:two-component system heavy metal sensor histidine kinase CusS
MTRRITLAILLTVWAMLAAAGVAVYWSARPLLLADLDATLVEEAANLPELVPPRRHKGSPVALIGEDRYRIEDVATGRKVRPPAAGGEGVEPQVVAASSSVRADGLRLRTVTIRTLAQPRPEADAATNAATNAPGAADVQSARRTEPREVLVTYTGSAEPFHRLMDRLAVTLAAVGLAGAAIAAAIAYRVSRAALRPLRRTADVIGTIDERRLDRRIRADELPAELVPMAGRLNEMLQRLEEAFAQRRQFLADASHELRTPVAALMMGLEVALARPRDAESYRRALRDALGDAAQLRRLVETLMEQVRSERFAHEEPTAAADVSALLDECVAVVGALAAPRGVTVRRRYPGGLRLTTQPNRLRSVMTNLLANAVEYNRPGGAVELVASASADGGLDLDVRDTGPGIPEDLVPRLFEPFSRGDGARGGVPSPPATEGGDGAGHLGIGLFLVRSHLDALGGTCTVDSLVGQGTTFRVHLPAADGGGVEAPLPTPTRPGDSGMVKLTGVSPAGRVEPSALQPLPLSRAAAEAPA